MSPEGRERRLSIYSHLAIGLVALVPATTALCLGGAPTWTVWISLALSVGALGLAALGARAQRESIRVTGLVLLVIAVAALCGLQLIPLPLSALRVLSPEAAALREFALIPLGLPSYGPLSLDPPATWRALVRALADVTLVIAATQLSRSSMGRRRLIQGVAAGGVLVATISLGHAAAGLESYFGLYTFEGRGSPFTSPFGNPNHLSAYLAITATCCGAAALLEQMRQRTLLWALGYALCGIVLVLSLSRGGIVFFVASQLLLGLLVWRVRARSDARASRPGAASRHFAVLLVGAGVVTVLAIGAFVAWTGIQTEIESVSSVEGVKESKITFWPMMFDAARKFSVSGMGRGSFEAAFTRYQTDAPFTTFTHPENIVLQFASELGLVPVVLLLLAAIVLVVHSLRKLEMTVLEAGAIAAVAGALLHDLFDFSLEFAPSGAAVLILLAICLRPLKGMGRERSEGASVGALRTGRLAPKWAVVAACVSAAVGTSAMLGRGGSTLRSAEQVLEAKIRSGASPEEISNAARSLIEAHPSDYFLYALVANAWSVAPAADPRHVLAYVNRTLFLRPLDSGSHLAAARSLRKLGRRGQSMLEYRLAYEAADWRVLQEASLAARSVAELAAIAPEDHEAAYLIATYVWSSNRRDLTLDYLSWARETFKDQPEAVPIWVLSSSYEFTVLGGEVALRRAQEARRLSPTDPRAFEVEASVLSRLNRHDEAVAVLREGLRSHIGRFEMTVALARSLHALGQRAAAHEVLKGLQPFVNDPSGRSRLFSLEADFLAAEGRVHKALDARLSASRVSPENAGYRYALARTYEEAGRIDDALSEVREGSRLEGRERSEVVTWVERLSMKQRERNARRMENLVAPAASTPPTFP